MPSPTAVPLPSLNTTVKVGRFCALPGTVAHTSTGAQTRCSRPAGQDRPRWVVDVGAEPGGEVRPGAYCPELGARGVAGGKDYSCTQEMGSSQGRWRANS
ncbi:hypothetical protein GCM10010468_21940 [Actinocorallia longicatena]|uniref:Uncharacterized protein n=2 Tax=Actinocorallia longicatena TaxID=111803 RepID=A0ABP6QBY8_9ACTN